MEKCPHAQRIKEILLAYWDDLAGKINAQPSKYPDYDYMDVAMFRYELGAAGPSKLLPHLKAIKDITEKAIEECIEYELSDD